MKALLVDHPMRSPKPADAATSRPRRARPALSRRLGAIFLVAMRRLGRPRLPGPSWYV